MPDLEAIWNWQLMVKSWRLWASGNFPLRINAASGRIRLWPPVEGITSLCSRSNSTSLGREDFLWRKFWGQDELETKLYRVEPRAPHFSFWEGPWVLQLSAGWLPTTIEVSTHLSSLGRALRGISKLSSRSQFTSGLKSSVCVPSVSVADLSSSRSQEKQ